MTSLQTRHAIYSVFFGIFFLACGSDARRVGLSGDSGTFSATKKPNARVVAAFSIKARPNELVSVQVDVFDALEEDNDTLMFREGKKGTVEHFYRKRGEDVLHTRSDNSDEETVTLPFTFHSTTKRLFIDYKTRNQRSKQGFVARYEKYPTNLCTKTSLIEDTTQLTCTQYNIAPAAANCSYIKDCPANLVTWGYAKCVKEIGLWDDTTTCIADPIQVEQCDIDDEGAVTNCDYSLSDIANYHTITDESDDWENFEFSLGRGNSGPKGTCKNMCRYKQVFHLRKPKRSCFNWRGRNFSLCILCRYTFRCTLDKLPTYFG